jgi:HD-like signal output (HDOD) protein
VAALKQEVFALTPRELVAQIEDLPSLPAIYFRVKSVIERPDSLIRDIEREIAFDAGLTSRLLCLANSAYYSVRCKLDSIGQAFSLLGAEQVKHLLLATSVASAFGGISPRLMDMRKFWLMNACRALIARSLARQDQRFDSERFFVEGLLGDLGHLVMYMGMPQAAEKALLTSRQTGAPLYRVEREQLGFDYAEVGAELLATWNFSREVEAAVRHHPVPLAAGAAAAREASILHIADLFTAAIFQGEEIEVWTNKVDAVVWVAAGLMPECLPDIRAEAESGLEALVHALLPDYSGKQILPHEKPQAAVPARGIPNPV